MGAAREVATEASNSGQCLCPVDRNGLRSQSISKKCDEPVADESRDRCNSEVGYSQNVDESPHKSPFPPHRRPLKFAHQEIGIEQEDDEPRLNHRSPDTFLHVLMLGRVGPSEVKLFVLAPEHLAPG